MSKYLRKVNNLTFAAFSKSPTGTSAERMMNDKSCGALQEVSKTLKSACTKNGSRCNIWSIKTLIEQPDGSYEPSHILGAQIVEKENEEA